MMIEHTEAKLHHASPCTVRIEDGLLVGYDPELDCTFCGNALPTIHNDEIVDHEQYEPSVDEWEVEQ
jgi:hypothetical protein